VTNKLLVWSAAKEARKFILSVSLAPQFIRDTVNCTSRDSVSHLLTHLVVYKIARCSSLNTTTFCLIHICPVLPHPTLYLEKTTIKLRVPQEASDYLMTYYDDKDLGVRRKYQGTIIIPIFHSKKSEDLHMDIVLIFRAITLSPSLRCYFEAGPNMSNKTHRCVKTAQQLPLPPRRR